MGEARKQQLRLFLRLLLVVTLCVIWGNSLLSREDSAALSGGLTAWLRSIGLPVSNHFVRKTAHFCEFGLLGAELVLLMRLRGGRGFQCLCNSAFAALLAAVTDETIQVFSGRGSQVLDVVLDFSGAVAGILLCTLIAKRSEKKNPTQ